METNAHINNEKSDIDLAPKPLVKGIPIIPTPIWSLPGFAKRWARAQLTSFFILEDCISPNHLLHVNETASVFNHFAAGYHHWLDVGFYSSISESEVLTSWNTVKNRSCGSSGTCYVIGDPITSRIIFPRGFDEVKFEEIKMNVAFDRDGVASIFDDEPWSKGQKQGWKFKSTAEVEAMLDTVRNEMELASASRSHRDAVALNRAVATKEKVIDGTLQEETEERKLHTSQMVTT
jgi:hypothetical protein